MDASEKTVFISYRRAPSKYLAAHLYDDLTKHGYDVFYDIRSIGSGDFFDVILRQIAARKHFILLLSLESLQRCSDPNDLLRREIEYAIDTGRNIIPFVTDGFDFYANEIKLQLTGKLAALSGYNALNAPYDFLEEAFVRLREQYLNQPTKHVTLASIPAQDQAFVRQTVSQAEAFRNFVPQFLTAEQYFNRAYSRPPTDYAGQIGDYTSAIQLNPQYADAFNNRGFARFNLGDMDGAIADYDAAIWLNPHFTIAFVNRGNAYARKGNLAQAAADYSSAIQLSPSDDRIYFSRAVTRFSSGDIDGAIADYNSVIQLNPQNADAYNNRGWAWASKADLNRAIDDYSAAIRINPQYALVYHNRAAAYNDQGNYTAAHQDYDSAIQLNPGNARLFIGRSWARLNLRDLEGAIADCNEAQRLSPSEILAYMNRGTAYLMQGDVNRAYQDYQQANQLFPQSADPYLGMGNCFFQVGQLTDALRQYKQYVQLSENPHPDILDRIAQMSPTLDKYL